MRISKLFPTTVVAAGLAAAQSQVIAVAVDNVSGPMMVAGFTGQCEAQSWAFGATDPTSSTTQGAAAPKPQISALVLTRQLDTCSPKLFSFATIGQHINTVKLTELRAGNKPIMVVTLSEAMVSNYQIAGSESSPAPAESVSFIFSKITFEYFPLKPDGSLDTPITVSYDLSRGY